MSCELSIQRTLGGGGSATIRCFGVITASPPGVRCSPPLVTSTSFAGTPSLHRALGLSRQSCLVLLLNTSTFHPCKMSEATQYPSALPISLLLALHGFRKGSLSPTGAVAAFAAGYGHIANPLKVFGVTLIAFYFLGSRATKVRRVPAASFALPQRPVKLIDCIVGQDRAKGKVGRWPGSLQARRKQERRTGESDWCSP